MSSFIFYILLIPVAMWIHYSIHYYTEFGKQTIHLIWEADHISSNFLKAVFHKFYLVQSWILCPIWKLTLFCWKRKSLTKINHSKQSPLANVNLNNMNEPHFAGSTLKISLRLLWYFHSSFWAYSDHQSRDFRSMFHLYTP